MMRPGSHLLFSAMYTNKGVFFFAILTSGLWHNHTMANEVLHLTPTTCVSLQQGRSCHTQVQVTWQLAQADNVCLYLQQQVLQCWQASASATWRWRFEYSDSQQLTLWRIASDGQPQELLDSATVQVNWVHHAKKKRLWRRF